MPKWEKGVFKVCGPEGKRDVSGYVFGPFGIHRPKGTGSLWNATHVGTGYSVGMWIGPKARIQKYIERVLDIVPEEEWQFGDPLLAPQEAKKEKIKALYWEVKLQ